MANECAPDEVTHCHGQANKTSACSLNIMPPFHTRCANNNIGRRLLTSCVQRTDNALSISAVGCQSEFWPNQGIRRPMRPQIYSLR